MDRHYQLYTDVPDTDELRALVARVFPAFTTLPARGRWGGQDEDTTVIDIVASSRDLFRVHRLASDIAALFEKDSVLVSVAPCEAELITA